MSLLACTGFTKTIHKYCNSYLLLLLTVLFKYFHLQTRFMLQHFPPKKFSRFLLIDLFSLSAFSVSMLSFKYILTTHLAVNFCLTCLDRCVSTVDLPNCAVSEIRFIRWCCACFKSLSKSSDVYMCVLSVSIHLLSVFKLPCGCSKREFQF